jgi:hypothetical protein
MNLRSRLLAGLALSVFLALAPLMPAQCCQGKQVAAAGEKQAKPAPASSGASAVTTGTTEPTKDLPVIGHLELQGKILTLKAGAKGTVYDVTDKAGKVLARNLSADELKTQAPEVYNLLKTAVGTAKAGDKSREVIDASVQSSVR